MRTRKETFIVDQKTRLRESQISRRQFVGSMLATGVVLPTALCWADDVAAATPKKGGSFRLGVGHGQTTDTLDPATFENGFTTNAAFMWGNTLTEVMPDGQLVGEVAESFEASDDAKTWRFKVRGGLEFHNGKSVGPDDVIASLNHHRGEASKSAVKGNIASVTEMRADGQTVEFELSEGNADFPFLLSDYHFLIVPAKDGAIDATGGIGTGPYIVDEFEPGVRFTAHRNPNYFKSDRAHFDDILMLALIDLTARQSALLTGDVHAIDRVDPKTVGLLGRAPNVNVLEETSTLHYTMPMRVTTEPFDNADLRMALKLSVKRQELVDKVLSGHGAVGNDHPISTANRFYASDLPQREFDPDKAAELYKKSGHSGPIQLSTSDAAFAGAVDAALLISASAKEAGIDINVVREAADGYWSNVWNKKGWCTCYWSGRPTEDWMFSSAYVDNTEWNDTDWRTTEDAKRFNSVVKEARSELDEAKRRVLYAEAQTLIHDDGGALIPMFANHIMGLSKEVSHGKVAANWELDGAKAAERWWFA